MSNVTEQNYENEDHAMIAAHSSERDGACMRELPPSLQSSRLSPLCMIRSIGVANRPLLSASAQ